VPRHWRGWFLVPWCWRNWFLALRHWRSWFLVLRHQFLPWRWRGWFLVAAALHGLVVIQYGKNEKQSTCWSFCGTCDAATDAVITSIALPALSATLPLLLLLLLAPWLIVVFCY